MEIKVSPAESLSGKITVPPSKSITHRAIVFASLAKGESIIRNPLISADTASSIEACESFGAGIDPSEESLSIQGVDGGIKSPKKPIDARNSGTTLRIMSAVAALCPETVILSGDESIQKRPMQPLLDALEQLGVKTSSRNGMPPVSVKGPMQGGRCRIRGDVSSQFISGLLIACPLARKDTDIEIITDIKSRPYLDITLGMLEEFHGSIENNGNLFRIPGSQIYESADYEVEGDYSSAALILAAAALTDSDIELTNLKPDSRQGDRRIIDIFREMGVSLRASGEKVVVRGPANLSGIKLDLSDNPDLVPPVAVVACLAKGKTLIENVGHLRLKESDRLEALTAELSKMGAKIKAGKDFLEIQGITKLRGARLQGWNDHRIVMALAAAGLAAEGQTVIDSAESIPVSFPGYIEGMKALGADIKPL